MPAAYPNRVFTVEQAVFIKENLIRGVTVAEVARHFGVSTETISKIKRGLTYRDVRVQGEGVLRPKGVLGEEEQPGLRGVVGVRAQTEEELDEKVKESQKRLFAALGMNPDGTVPD
jgi:transposase-like protein